MTESSSWEPIPGEDIAFQRFLCDVPPPGIAFQVLEDEWSTVGDIWYRTIRKVRIVSD